MSPIYDSPLCDWKEADEYGGHVQQNFCLGVCGRILPLDGTLSVHETLEWLPELVNVTRAGIRNVVSQKWVKHHFFGVNYPFKATTQEFPVEHCAVAANQCHSPRLSLVVMLWLLIRLQCVPDVH